MAEFQIPLLMDNFDTSEQITSTFYDGNATADSTAARNTSTLKRLTLEMQDEEPYYAVSVIAR